MHLASIAPGTGAHRGAGLASACAIQGLFTMPPFQPSPGAYRDMPGGVGIFSFRPARWSSRGAKLVKIAFGPGKLKIAPRKGIAP